MQKKYYIGIFISIIALVQFRILPHPPNFTPILAAGIYAGYFFKKFYLAAFIIFFGMLIGDLYLGLHGFMFFTYSALLFPVILGIYLKKDNSLNLLISSLFSSIVFFIVTNFGVWLLSGMYENNFNGLIKCYIAAIPFFHNTILSTLIFVYLIKF